MKQLMHKQKNNKKDTMTKSFGVNPLSFYDMVYFLFLHCSMSGERLLNFIIFVDDVGSYKILNKYQSREVGHKRMP
jgi:hypothetical protein